MKRRKHRNDGQIFRDFPQARKAAAQASKAQGRLIVARKAPGGGYVLGAVKLPNRRRKNPGMAKTMGEFKRGTLKTSAGRRVKSRRQAVAIGMSEQRRAQNKLPKMFRRKSKRAKRQKKFLGAYHKIFGSGLSRRKKNAPRRVIRRRRRNDGPQIIGSAPSLTIKNHGTQHFPAGRLRPGPDSHSVYLDLGGAKAPAPGSQVTRVEYDDPAKAVSAYGRIDRFTHACRSPFVVGPASNGSVTLTSKSQAWKGE